MGELVGYIPSTNNMERLIKALFVLYIVSFIVSAREEEHKKAISIFNVVKFKNDVCAGGGNQNGTCYTAEECSAIDGTASGTCAEGYGVCCIVSLSCGSSSKQNCTYMVQAATTAPTTNPCTYTICPMSSNICRIRLDFATFVIGGPTSGTFTQDRGACITDTFTASSSAGAVPVICGTNTGQHMIVIVMGKHVQQHHSHLEELQQTEHMISRFFNLTAKMKWVGQLDAYSILALTWVHFLHLIMVVSRSPLICRELI